MSNSFIKTFTFEKRFSESNRIKKKYPNRIPVIVEKKIGSDIPNIDKTKYLVPGDLTISQFLYVIRKRINLRDEQAIFIFIDNKIPFSQSLIKEIYTQDKHMDGFLYFEYSGENTFGLIQQFCDEVITVTTDEICASIKDIFEENRSKSVPEV